MDKGTTDRGLADCGVSSVQFLLASALALLLFLAFANLVAVQYGRGALRSALDQGARAGALSGSVDDCEAKVGDVVGQLLGGRMSDGLVVRCAVSGDVMIADGSAMFESWTPLTTDFAISMASEAAMERAP